MPKQRLERKLSSPAIKHMVVANMASAILQVRKKEDVVAKAVGITKEKKILNQNRKELAKFENKLDEIVANVHNILSSISMEDVARVGRGHSKELVEQIPEKSTNPEVLALYMMFVNFQDCPDKKMDEILKPLLAEDYIDLVDFLSVRVGLEKNVADDLYWLAVKLIEDIKR